MIRVAGLLAIALIVSGCGPSVDSFSIHRFTVARGQNEFPPLDRTVSDPGAAARLYERIRGMPPQSARGTVFCAMDWGVRYELSFFARGERVLHGVMDMGCHVIDLGAADIRAFDDSFEAELLGALGLYTRGHELWPTPLPRL